MDSPFLKDDKPFPQESFQSRKGLWLSVNRALDKEGVIWLLVCFKAVYVWNSLTSWKPTLTVESVAMATSEFKRIVLKQGKFHLGDVW